MIDLREVEKKHAYLCDKLDRELYLKTIAVPTSKLIFTQPFLIEYRIRYHTEQPIPAGNTWFALLKKTPIT